MRTEISYPNDLEHFESCKLGLECSRCRFEHGFHGRLRRGAKSASIECSRHEWSRKCLFMHPTYGERCWLAVRPYTMGGPFAVGCWLCHEYPSKGSSSFSRLEVDPADAVPSAFKKHGESESHKKAFEKMQLALQPDSSSHVVESGDSSIPKITRFMLAATVVSRHDSFSDYSAYMNVIASTSVSLEGSDLSRQGCLKMVQCMALPLERCDQDVMRHVSRQLHCNTCFKFGLVELTLN